MKSLLTSLLLIVAILSVNAFAEEKKASTGQAYLEKFLNNTRTLKANFQQTLRTAEGEVLQQTNGEFYLSRPKKFRWNYRAPYEQEIVSDGDSIWIYDVDLQQVTVQKQAASLPTTPMALMEDSSRLYQSFNVSPLDEHDGIYRLKLLSKTRETDFSEIVVGVDEKGLRFMQLHDQFMQVTDIVFSDITTNTGLSEKLFRFVPPAGVDVFGG